MTPGATAAMLVVLFAAAIGLQVSRDRVRHTLTLDAPLWVQSGPLLKRLSLGFESLVSDVYWIRTVVYYGGQRRQQGSDTNYDLLDPLLRLVTTLDPRFRVAYRFGAIFLSEGYPSGPGRPDQAVRLLERGIAHDPNRWEYMHDIGFVYYWSLHDYERAAAWFAKGAALPGAPSWLGPLAATTLAAGGSREASRAMWLQMRESSDIEWVRSSAERSLMQLDALDIIDALNVVADRFEAREGRRATAWEELVRGERLRGIPVDPTGTPYALDPSTGRIGLSQESSLWPPPREPGTGGAPAPPPPPPSPETPASPLAGRGGTRRGLRDTENAPSETETQRETGAFPLSPCLRRERASVPRSPWPFCHGLPAAGARS